MFAKLFHTSNFQNFDNNIEKSKKGLLRNIQRDESFGIACVFMESISVTFT